MIYQGRQAVGPQLAWQVVVLPVILVVSLGIGALASPSFLREANLTIIASGASAIGVIAVAMTFVMLMRGLDLSVGSVVGLAAVVAASAEGLGIVGMLMVGLSAGLAFGALNGALVAIGRAAPAVSTVASLLIARAIAYTITDGEQIQLADDRLDILSGRLVGIVPFQFLLFVGAVVIGTGVIGAGLLRAARPTNGSGLADHDDPHWAISWSVLLVYVVCGVAAAGAGVMLLSRIGDASPVLGTGIEAGAMAAVMLGGTWIGSAPRMTSVIGTALGVLIIAVVTNILIIADVSPFIASALPGVVIVAAIAVQFVLRLRSTSSTIIPSSSQGLDTWDATTGRWR